VKDFFEHLIIQLSNTHLTKSNTSLTRWWRHCNAILVVIFFPNRIWSCFQSLLRTINA